ncbi:MAG: hypothetical protein CMN32_09395 [Saprospirales bacterium]|nr:hypothetical protein [Saprospirales bacterium]
MDLVVNEWLPEYFRPDASPEEKRALEKFLLCFLERGDKIIVLKPSPFLYKIYRYAKEFQRQYEAVLPIRNFIKTILLNSERCILVSAEEIEELPQNIQNKLAEGNYGSDSYLFETASVIRDSARKIITTDTRLKNHFQDEEWCEIVLLHEFLDSYCNDT